VQEWQEEIRQEAFPSSYKGIQLRKTLLVMRNDELVRTFVQMGDSYSDKSFEVGALDRLQGVISMDNDPR
jgi:hypothetical protein